MSVAGNFGERSPLSTIKTEQVLAAQKAERKIAIEIKSFTGLSEMNDLEKAIGQYIVYHDVLAEIEPERKLYLAIPEEISLGLFEEPIGKLLLRNNRVLLLVFNPKTEVIVKWIP